MASFVALWGKLTDDRIDDDVSDRLNHRITAMILIIFAVLVSTSQYVGDPINCWVPAHFSGSHEKYTDDYCWIRNTYYLPFENDIPREHEDEKRHMIPYYQWLPLILLLQALLFNLPIILWRSMTGKSGVDVNNIVDAANSIEALPLEETEDKDRIIEFMCKQMDRYLANEGRPPTGATISLKHCFSRTCCFCCGHRRGNYINMLYLFVKLLFIVNVIGQMFLMNFFLGTSFSTYGIDVLSSLVAGEDWTQSERFPRITMCDLKVRRLGNVQRYSVQCVLPINLFNEKIYLFLWWWFVIVAVVSCLSFIQWIARSFFMVDRYKYIKRHIQEQGFGTKLNEDQKRRVVTFVEKYLQQDGVFVLQLVGHNTNKITVDEFVTGLFKHYEKNNKQNV